MNTKAYSALPISNLDARIAALGSAVRIHLSICTIRLGMWLTDCARALRRLVTRRSFPPEGGSRPPDAGRPAPLNPSPTHHLIAAKALPPSEDTWLYPRD